MILPEILAEEKQQEISQEEKTWQAPAPQPQPQSIVTPSLPRSIQQEPLPSQPRPQFQPSTETRPRQLTPAGQPASTIPQEGRPSVAPSFPNQSTRQNPASVVAPAPASFQSQPKAFTRPPSGDIYREQISETDTKKFQPPPSSRPPVPKLEGNIINLKDLEK